VHGEGTPFAGNAGDSDVATGGAGQFAGDGQAQAGASQFPAVSPIYPVEAVKDVRQVLSRNTRPAVGDGDPYLAAVRSGAVSAQPHPARGSVLDGVLQLPMKQGLAREKQSTWWRADQASGW
jgi:hypothetical protein